MKYLILILTVIYLSAFTCSKRYPVYTWDNKIEVVSGFYKGCHGEVIKDSDYNPETSDSVVVSLKCEKNSSISFYPSVLLLKSDIKITEANDE